MCVLEKLIQNDIYAGMQSAGICLVAWQIKKCFQGLNAAEDHNI